VREVPLVPSTWTIDRAYSARRRVLLWVRFAGYTARPFHALHDDHSRSWLSSLATLASLVAASAEEEEEEEEEEDALRGGFRRLYI